MPSLKAQKLEVEKKNEGVNLLIRLLCIYIVIIHLNVTVCVCYTYVKILLLVLLSQLYKDDLQYYVYIFSILIFFKMLLYL